jgi:putative endonuclease
MSDRSTGTQGEELAARFLETHGYQIVERNFRSGRGEIDLIAKDGGELVFVEVKSRRSSQYGEPEESITRSKEAQLKRVAEGYLFHRGIENQSCRFDVVAITYDQRTPVIRLIQNVFVM